MDPIAHRGLNRLIRMRLVLPILLVATALGSLVLAGCGGPGRAVVVLQLNWYHEAEFAGYYMAEAKGFYEDLDLGVTIMEGGPGFPARDRVIDGSATFAVTSFAEQRQLVESGEPVIAIMAAFQIPPLVIFSLTASDIVEPSDLVGRTVGVTTDYWRRVLEETLVSAGVDPTEVRTVDVEPDQLSMLYDRQVDAWLGYAQDEPIRAQTDGHPVTNIFPADFGVGGYEGLVIVREDTISADPTVVERFLQATSEGWRYAIEHVDETAEVLAAYAPASSLEFHRLAVRAVIPLVDTPQVPVGWIDEGRWRRLMDDSFDQDRPGYSMDYFPVRP